MIVLELDDLFHQIAAILVLAVVAGAIASRLRQPLIVAFIAVGILAGPAVLDIVAEDEPIELLAGLGIALLLFVVGLRLNPALIRTLGPVALATGLGQVAFTSGIGFLIAVGLGLGATEAAYVAVALTFSSTIIIVKLLSDKRETEELHGRVAIGLLIVQDIVVVFAMIALTAIGTAEGTDATREVLEVLGKAAAFLAVVLLAMRFALAPVAHRMAHNPELLVLFSIGWAIALAATGDLLGFSKEVGAFLAGVSLAATPYRDAIGARLVGLRDFLILFFFIDLGASLDLGQLGDQIVPALVLSAFVLIGNPLIVMTIMAVMGYRKRVSFLTGLTVAQISEFSLILAALGATLGQIGDEEVALITAVGLVTITTSTYLILYSKQIYERIEPALSIFERDIGTRPDEDLSGEDQPEVDVILFGLGRYGSSLTHELEEDGHRVYAVDFDPRKVRARAESGCLATYGDVEDPELPGSLPLDRARWVISTIPQVESSRALVHALSTHGFQGRVAVTAHTLEDARKLEGCGAEEILTPFADSARDVAERLGLAD